MQLVRKWGPVRWWGIEINKIVEDFYLAHHTIYENLTFTVGVHFQKPESERYGVMYVDNRTIAYGSTPQKAKEKLDELLSTPLTRAICSLEQALIANKDNNDLRTVIFSRLKEIKKFGLLSDNTPTYRVVLTSLYCGSVWDFPLHNDPLFKDLDKAKFFCRQMTEKNPKRKYEIRKL